MARGERLGRFLRLERARPERPEASAARPPEATEERIAALERPEPAPSQEARPVTGASLERFGPEPEPRIELVEADEGRRPFVRCRRCSMDNNAFATTCQGCGLSLDTPEQREFDERFFAARAKEDEREKQAEAELREVRARAEAEDAQARRAMGEALAREVGESERRRLGSWWGWDQPLGPRTFLGLKLVRLLPDERMRLPAFGAALLGGGAIAVAGILAGSGPVLAVGGALLFALLVRVPD